MAGRVRERAPDWYFFTDIVGVRIAADGTVLDSDPIVIRPEQSVPANDYASSPSVSSDGLYWAVCWEDTDWQAFRQVIKGTRISNDGFVIDSNFVTLYDNAANKKTRAPEMSFAQGRYLSAWQRGSGTDVATRTLNTALQPLTPPIQIGTTSGGFSVPRIATDGNLHFVVSGFRSSVGALGADFLVTANVGSSGDNSGLYAARVRGTDGLLLDPTRCSSVATTRCPPA